eukprot:scaffold89534_cov27-Tisochrysis_lutea.AAC.5
MCTPTAWSTIISKTSSTALTASPSPSCGGTKCNTFSLRSTLTASPAGMSIALGSSASLRACSRASRAFSAGLRGARALLVLPPVSPGLGLIPPLVLEGARSLPADGLSALGFVSVLLLLLRLPFNLSSRTLRRCSSVGAFDRAAVVGPVPSASTTLRVTRVPVVCRAAFA